MFKYTTIYINTVSLIISIIIFLIFNMFVSNYKNLTQKTSFRAGFRVENLSKENELKTNSEILQEETKIEVSKTEEIKIEENKIQEEKLSEKDETWYLEIPKINLKASIQEGTTKEIMDDYIGHFEDTSKDLGNIGLAAHNRGYKNNYFEGLKKLKEGDEILYYYNGILRKYIVIEHCIIKDIDWSYLENTQENRITLITCVENEPEYRRCVQGIEKK